MTGFSEPKVRNLSCLKINHGFNLESVTPLMGLAHRRDFIIVGSSYPFYKRVVAFAAARKAKRPLRLATSVAAQCKAFPQTSNRLATHRLPERTFVSHSGTTFPHRRVERDAFHDAHGATFIARHDRAAAAADCQSTPLPVMGNAAQRATNRQPMAQKRSSISALAGQNHHASHRLDRFSCHLFRLARSKRLQRRAADRMGA